MALNSVNSTTASPLIPNADSGRKSEIDPSAPASKADQAHFSAAATSLAATSQGADINNAKIVDLKARIADGSYKPNASAIAKQLLQEAWSSNPQ